MNLAPVFKQQFLDNNGAVLAGGKLYSYLAGTTTLQATYANATGTANANPVVLDSAGRADVWLDPTLAYKIVLQDANGVQIYSEDNIQVTTSGISVWNANQVYSQGDLVQDASGQGLLYVSLTNNNVNQPLTNVSAWRVFAGNVRTVSTATTLSVTDDLVRSNSTAGNLTHTLPACASTPSGKRITIKDVGTGGNLTTVQGSGTDTVDGNIIYIPSLPQNGAVTVTNNGTSWDTTAQLDGRKAPTMSVVTATSHTGRFSANSTGTYTPPTPLPKYIRVRMVGGGGGGGGGDHTGGASGTSGGNTTFGSSLSAGGGGGGAHGGLNGAGGGGGTAVLGGVTTGFGFTGSPGGSGGDFMEVSGGVTGTLTGPSGGSSPFGGAGIGALQAAPTAALPNSGSGGAGGSADASASVINQRGGGGGSGAYIEALLPGSIGALSYAVGAKGTGGAGSTGGYAGGDGASGIIIVEEYY